MRYRVTLVGGIKLHIGTVNTTDAQLLILKHAPRHPVFVRNADPADGAWAYVLEINPERGLIFWCDGEEVPNPAPLHRPIGEALINALSTAFPSHQGALT